MQSCIMPIVRTTADLGAVLRRRRRDLSLTQEQVAFSAGVNRRVVGELERGTREVVLKNVLAVIAALGLDVDLVPRGRDR